MSLSKEALAWSEAVFGGCELGDSRRTRRLVKMSAQMSAHAGEAPVSACRGDSAACEGAYRLLRNKHVDAAAIAEGGFRSTARSAAGTVGALLALEDSTSLSYAHAVVDELGDLGGPASSNKRGFIVHSVLIVEAASGRTVGLIEQERWCREVAQRGQRHQPKTFLIHEQLLQWGERKQVGGQVGAVALVRATKGGRSFRGCRCPHRPRRAACR